MAEQSTIAVYPLDGTNRKFVVPYEYLARRFVTVALLGDTRTELTLGKGFRFITANQIETTQAWGAGDGYTNIEIRRETSVTQRLVDFYDGSVLRSRDLNVSAIQTIHIAEEARNLAAYTLAEDDDGNLDARGRRLVNLGDAVNPKDALTLDQVMRWSQSALNQANRSQEEADKSAASAQAAAHSASQSDAVPLRQDLANPDKGAAMVGVTLDGSNFGRTQEDKNREIVTPYDFGAVGDGVADDTSSLQEFVNFIMQTRAVSAQMFGKFRVTSKLSFIGTPSSVKTIWTDCEIISDFASDDEVVRFENWTYAELAGRFSVRAKGGTAWSSRENRDCIVIHNCTRFCGDFIEAIYARSHGVILSGTTSLPQIKHLRTPYCGSARDGAVGKTINAVSVVRTGNINSTGQRSIITVDEVPVDVEALNTFCNINGELYAITEVDADNKTITVYPFVPKALGSSFDVRLYIGGGVYNSGGDVSAGLIGRFDAFVCGVGIKNFSLYPLSITSAAYQSCGIAHAFGATLQSAAQFGCSTYSYYEANGFDLLRVTSSNVGYVFTSTMGIDLAKCTSITFRDGNDNISSAGAHLGTIQINTEGAMLGRSRYRSTIIPGPIPTHMSTTDANSASIDLKIDEDRSRLFGYDNFYLMATGRSASGPSGSFTFNPAAGESINGGAVGEPLIVSGMRHPTLFFGRCVGTKWTIRQCDFSEFPVAASQSASSATDVAGLQADLNELLAKMKASGLMEA